MSQPTFKGLLNIDRLLRARLKVRDAALGLAESHRPLGRDLAVWSASRPITTPTASATGPARPRPR